MATPSQELEIRFTKLMLSSMLRTMDVLHPGINASETVHQNMLTICGGVRERALQTMEQGSDAAEATRPVDQLIQMIDEFFAYAAMPQFGNLEVINSE